MSAAAIVSTAMTRFTFDIRPPSWLLTRGNGGTSV